MRVQGPDGKMYEFPEGTTQEQAISYFRKAGARAAASPTDVSFSAVAPPKIESGDSPKVKLQNVLQSLGQGITFGWGDEITSSMAAGLATMLEQAPYKEAYNEILENQRAEGKKFASDFPGLDLGLQISSGLLTGKAPLEVVRKIGSQMSRVVPSAVSKVAEQAPRATSLLKSAAESGSLGAVAGAGYDDESAAEGAETGAAIGTVFGAVTPTVLAASKKMGSIGTTSLEVIANSLGLGSGDSVAKKRLLQAIQRDGTTPEKLLEQLKQDELMGYPVSLIDIAGPNVTNLAERVVKRSGDEYKNIIERHGKRLKDIPERAKSTLEADLVLSNPNSKSFYDWNTLLNKQESSIERDLTSRFVTEKREMPDIVQDKFYELIKGDGDFKDAFKVANQILKGRKDINIRDKENGLATLYYTKKGLDSMLASRRKPGFDPEVADRLQKKSDAVDSLLREMSGDYSSKADALSDIARKRSILETGTKIQDPKFTPDDLKGFLPNVRDEDDLSLFLSGVREASMNKLGKDIGRAPMSDLVFGVPGSSLNEKMALAYKPDPESLALMKDRIGKYDTMIGTSRSIPGLSTHNPLSAVIDPESRDVTLAMGASGLTGMLGLKGLSAPLAAFGVSRLIPSMSAKGISRAAYGPYEDTERLLAPLMRSPLREFADKTFASVGRQGIPQKGYGVLPQIFGREPLIDEDYGYQGEE